MHANYQILPLLVERGANIDYQNDPFEWTPLYSLFKNAISTHININRLLEEEDRNAPYVWNNYDPSAWKPYYTCLISPTNVNKSYFDIQHNRNTILGIALELKLWDICEYLLTDCHAATNLLHCRTLLPTWALLVGEIPINLFQIIIHNWDATSCSRNQFFQTALESKRFDIANFLITRYPAIINLNPPEIGTPLYYLTSRDSRRLQSIPPQLISSLITRESLSTQKRTSKRTPFENALFRNNTFMIKILIPLIPSEQLKFVHKYITRKYGHISLQYLCAFAIRHTLHDNAYNCLPLPPILTNFIKTLNIEHMLF